MKINIYFEKIDDVKIPYEIKFLKFFDKTKQILKFSFFIKQMKILALIVQNKKGVNIFVITTNNFSSKLALHHSRSIYDFIIKQFSKKLFFKEGMKLNI